MGGGSVRGFQHFDGAHAHLAGAASGAPAQDAVRKILSEAKHALESGSAPQCTEALEKVAEMGRILSEVILYDPGSFATPSEANNAEES